MKYKCPQCGQPIFIPKKELKWLLEAKKRNPFLMLICSKCGDIEFNKNKNG